MAATYPHPIPNNNLNVVQNPTGATINNLPNVNQLVGDVAQWMTDNLAEGNSWINITEPGRVLVLANAQTDNPYPGFAHAEVLNGTMLNADILRLHTTWLRDNEAWLKSQRSPKLKAADPKFAYGPNELLEENALPPDLGGSNNAFTDKVGKRIIINGHVDDGGILVHEYFHTFDPGDPSDVGWGFDEGIVDFFARDVAARFGYGYKGNAGYEGGYQTVKAIVDRIGLDKVCQFWFEREPSLFNPLSIKSKAVAEHCKPCAPSTVTLTMIDDFCQLAESLTGWKAPARTVAPVAKAAPSPAKKWPPVQPVGNVFRSHG